MNLNGQAYQNQGNAHTTGGIGFGSLEHQKAMAEQTNRAKGLAATECQPLPPTREIPAKIDRLFTLTEVLSERIARHSGRIQTLVNCGPSPKEQVKADPSGTIVGEQLSQIAARLALMIDAVEALDAALEV